VTDDDRPRLEEALHRIDTLASALDQVADAGAREAARELVELVLDLHGLALARSLAIIASAENGGELVERLAQDEQVRAALLLHGLHPEPVEARIGKALEGLQPQLGMLGCRLRLIKVGAGIVRLRLEGAHGPEGMRSLGLRQQIEAAIIDEAPDIDDIVIEGLEDAGVEQAALAAG
jgi:Fe-S cluster biogenesis protein NfuA